MSKRIDCKYSQDSEYEIAGIMCCTCALTRRVMNANVESECNCFNCDLSAYDICYNCKYYIGGGDWGLFCSHKDMYHHLGRFSDEPCVETLCNWLSVTLRKKRLEQRFTKFKRIDGGRKEDEQN